MKKTISWLRIIKIFLPFVKKYKISFVVVLLAYGLGVLADNIIAPFLIRKIIDILSVGSVTALVQEEAYKYLFLMLGSLALTRLMYVVGDYTITYFQNKVLEDLHNFSFAEILKHSYQFFINTFSGSLVKLRSRFVSSFEDICDTFVYNIWVSLVKVIGTFVVLFYLSRMLSAVFLAWSVIFIAVSYYLARKKISLDIIESEIDTKVSGRSADVFSNVLNVKMFASITKEIMSFGEVVKEQRVARIRTWNYQNFIYILQGILVVWLQVFLLFVAIYLYFEGSITLGTVLLVTLYSDTVLSSIWHLGKQLARLSRSFSYGAEMVEIIDEDKEIRDTEKPKEFTVSNGEINFRNVSFSYKSGGKIFDGFNLKIQGGEKVGLIGSSGAGKSTITKLILRFTDVTEGEILVDGTDIRTVTQDDLRREISYVPQEPILFHRTLKENIAYGMPNASMEEIIKSAKKAHADEFISRLKDGYDTLVGERGVKLSGGERQRVAIARAILKNAPILILDEATSSLDSESEKLIQESLDVLMKDKTVIVIAHRLSTIQKMDRIVVLEEGKVVEEGTHKELLSKGGRYATLWKHQSGGFIE